MYTVLHSLCALLFVLGQVIISIILLLAPFQYSIQLLQCSKCFSTKYFFWIVVDVVGIIEIKFHTGMDKTSLDTSSGSLFVTHSLSPRHVERNYVPLFGVTQSKVDLRYYVISRQIVI